VLRQGRLWGGAELRLQVGVLLRRDLAAASRQRLGCEALRFGERLEVAIDGAGTHAEDAGGVDFAGAGADCLHQVTAKIEGVGTHGKHL
jgi:hypothetical protein